MPDTGVSARQRQSANGRRAFLERFPDDESEREHFRDLAQRSAAGRFTLSADEASALSECYNILTRIAARHPKIAGAVLPNEKPAGCEPAGGEGR